MRDASNTYVAVVDDDESLCRSLKRLLSASGFQSIAYPSAEAFLADPQHPDFDCLVLDIQLGGMSGIELHRQLVKDQETIPVIFLTAQEGPESRDEALAAGCAGYFHKHDSGFDVIEAIRRATS